MLIKAQQTFTRQTPRKLRLVANTVKKMSVEAALKQLAVIERRGTLVLLKVFKQAIANAINNQGLTFTDLEIDTITINEGPRFRRMRAVSRGRGHGIIKRSSHVTVILKTKAEAKATDTKVAPAALPAAAVTEVKAEKPAAPAKKAAAATSTKPKTTVTKKRTATNKDQH